MRDYTTRLGQGTGSDVYFNLGFCPGRVVVQGEVLEDRSEWWLTMAAGYAVESVDTDGVNPALTTDTGITLVTFSDEPGALPGSGGTPVAVEPGRWWEANGIRIESTAAAIANGNPFMVYAWRLDVPYVRAVHDGTTDSDTYFEDSSIDFLEAGVSSNGKFIIINESNDNYAYVGTITKPSTKTRYCRIYTFEDERLETATAGANFDTADVCYIIPRQYVQYPLSDLGLMT
jgi:hypothetical protein